MPRNNTDFTLCMIRFLSTSSECLGDVGERRGRDEMRGRKKRSYEKRGRKKRGEENTRWENRRCGVARRGEGGKKEGGDERRGENRKREVMNGETATVWESREWFFFSFFCLSFHCHFVINLLIGNISSAGLAPPVDRSLVLISANENIVWHHG